MSLSILKKADPEKLARWLDTMRAMPKSRHGTGVYVDLDGCMCAMGVQLLLQLDINPVSDPIPDRYDFESRFKALDTHLLFAPSLGIKDLSMAEGTDLFWAIVDLNDGKKLSWVEIADEIERRVTCSN